MDITRTWPVVSSCSFSHHLTSLVYQGATTSTGSGSDDEGQDRPKGVFILTNASIPSHVMDEWMERYSVDGWTGWQENGWNNE